MTSCLLVVGQAKVTLTGRIFKMTHQGSIGGEVWYLWLPCLILWVWLTCTIVHKCLNGCAPVNLSNDLQYTGQRQTGMCSASAALLQLSRSRTAIGDRSFSIAGPRIWNTLPASVRDTNSSLRFRKFLKAFLFVWPRRWRWTGALKWTHLTCRPTLTLVVRRGKIKLEQTKAELHHLWYFGSAILFLSSTWAWWATVQFYNWCSAADSSLLWYAVSLITMVVTFFL